MKYLTKKFNTTCFILILMLLGTSCSQNTLKEDVVPLADAMCEFIRIQNDLQKAISEQDSAKIEMFSEQRRQINIEMTVLNEEFKEKYGEKVNDQEFGKKFRMEMNKAMIGCPHLNDADRDRMLQEIEE
jgi:hypothetical protein